MTIKRLFSFQEWKKLGPFLRKKINQVRRSLTRGDTYERSKDSTVHLDGGGAAPRQESKVPYHHS